MNGSGTMLSIERYDKDFTEKENKAQKYWVTWSKTAIKGNPYSAKVS